MKCIDGTASDITEGKHYRILERSSISSHLRIVNDKGEIRYFYNKDLFEHSTIHSIMGEALEPEEYERWCKNTKPGDTHRIIKTGFLTPNEILTFGFYCADSEEGRSYWSKVHDRLLNTKGEG